MKTRRFALVVLYSVLAAVAVLVPTGLRAAEIVSADTPLVDEKIRQVMQDRNYAEAVKAIDEAAKAKDAPQDYLAYLRAGRSTCGKQYDEAIAVFDQLAEGLSQERVAPPGPVRQGRGPGPQGRLPRAPS